MAGVLTYASMACAGALGAVARYGVDAVVSRRVPGDLPFGILVVNLTGTLAVGALSGLLLDGPVPSTEALILGTGFLGAYTTFSTWMLDSLRLVTTGETAWLPVINLAGSLVLGFGAAALGYGVGTAVG